MKPASLSDALKEFNHIIMATQLKITVAWVNNQPVTL